MRKQLAEVSEQRDLAARSRRNAGIDVQRIVGIERDEPRRIVAGPGRQPALRELRGLGRIQLAHQSSI